MHSLSIVEYQNSILKNIPILNIDPERRYPTPAVSSRGYDHVNRDDWAKYEIVNRCWP
jgi:hypothetical protein